MNRRLLSGLLLSVMVLICACGQKAPTWQEQYDLGVRYLSEGNYEEAIIAFTAAIEIDPKQAPAYVGRGDAYTAQGKTLADITKAYELYQKAAADYEQAVTLGSADVQSKLDDLKATIQLLQANVDANPLLKELFPLMRSGDLEGAKALMRQPDYRAMSAAAGDGFFTYSESDDVCLAVYQDNCYYFGAWTSGQRDGQGMWIQAAFEDDSNLDSQQYSGSWKNDRPNGDGELVTVKDLSKIQLSEGQTTSVRTEISGSFKDGLYHGTIYETWYMNDGGTHVWTPIKVIDGVYQPMPDVPDDITSRPYYQENVAADHYVVAVDQLNVQTDLWFGTTVHSVFGFGGD